MLAHVKCDASSFFPLKRRSLTKRLRTNTPNNDNILDLTNDDQLQSIPTAALSVPEPIHLHNNNTQTAFSFEGYLSTHCYNVYHKTYYHYLLFIIYLTLSCFIYFLAALAFILS